MFNDNDLLTVKQLFGKIPLYKIQEKLEVKISYCCLKGRCRKIGLISRKCQKKEIPEEIKQINWKNFDYLNDLYVVQRKSTREISRILFISQPTICKYLKFFGIKLRDYHENKSWIKKGEKAPDYILKILEENRKKRKITDKLRAASRELGRRQKWHLGIKHSLETRKRLSEMGKLRVTPEEKERLKQIGAKGRRNQGLRKGPTKIEKILYDELDKMSISYKTQEILYGFATDCFIECKNLVIECDGVYWHSLPEAIEKDMRRDKLFKENGISVLHLKETELKSGDFKKTLHKILN